MRQPEKQEPKEIPLPTNPVDIAIQYLLDATKLLHFSKDDIELSIQAEFTDGSWTFCINDDDDTVEQSEGATLSEAITNLLQEIVPKVRGLSVKIDDIGEQGDRLNKAWGIPG